MLLSSAKEMLASAQANGLTLDELIDRMSDDVIDEIMALIEAEEYDFKFNRFKYMFPDETRMVAGNVFHARHMYGKHMRLFELGATIRSRLFMAANRVGKSEAGAYEVTCHLTGLYPHWWIGKRFTHPTRIWACGKTNETTRDIVQNKLMGDVTYSGNRKVVDGSGMIPRDCLGLHNGSLTWKQGVPDLVDTIRIKHVSGGWSKLGLKSYQQGRGAFEGTAMHFIWDDEEPPMDVYNEQAIRTATTKGGLLITFTPLEGMSDVVQQFLPDDEKVI